MDKLRALELFIATCEEGSFAAASAYCNTDPSAVSKAISRLEAQLQVTLIQRSTRQLSVTDAGKQYLSTARKLLQELSACEGEIKHLNDSPSGVLKVNSAVCYGHLYLRPVLAAFCAHYPEIKLDLQINDLHTDVIESGVDIAIRTGYVKDSRLVAKRLSPMDFFVCASPDYLDKNGIPELRDDFKAHHWIGFRIKETQQLQPIYLPDEQGDYALYDLEPSHITDDGEMMVAMCEDGLGFAQLPHFLAKAGLESGKLVSVYPHFRPPQIENGVFAIYPKRTYLPAKVRVFLSFLADALEKQNESAYQTWAEQVAYVR
ncbi:LysR family transcriptional regulator [Pseudoalteromonas luteoviolacea]|uniref:HTH lysR-type domain-containing protein n=1 Tax=Pseudoalteromonas luteoviolacea H33 TaxID=1365251 RepID=A0A167CMA0_9GAMM|nr:LysR family transcriptional regulator [Pseudoalteromonas luteoviolacea]KZN47835.1 hypothetical protein N476_22690 [Pseudoalteromonas luteoviolacea H33]KZN74623.1 hypothetical protein N477_21585 [Pseudoalteromonas luteoviolacea H33-S]MBQ4880048.1 LysR family transcriptional regulator [Pseudoalteromonas luteoviolacea]MBQ4909065.1 LysR family transcriptional regulator [Pseudoalteromonas luteoviolacea]